jgi:predicted DNA-binding transcriptional regulator AlpA
VVESRTDVQQSASLTEKEASNEYRLSPAWFQRKRWDGTGPKFYKIGRAVRYPRAELEQYFNARLRTSTSDTGGGK